MNAPLTLAMPHTDILRVELDVLTRQHRDLDVEIASLYETSGADIFTLQQLKRRKLAIKDQIARLKDRIIPDIIA